LLGSIVAWFIVVLRRSLLCIFFRFARVGGSLFPKPPPPSSPVPKKDGIVINAISHEGSTPALSDAATLLKKEIASECSITSTTYMILCTFVFIPIFAAGTPKKTTGSYTTSLAEFFIYVMCCQPDEAFALPPYFVTTKYLNMLREWTPSR
jgi:hypothetical protein